MTIGTGLGGGFTSRGRGVYMSGGGSRRRNIRAEIEVGLGGVLYLMGLYIITR